MRVPPVFTPADQLALLQLTARKSMASRRERESSDEDIERAHGALNLDTPLPPAKWRLIPKTVSLHDWQRKCLSLWLRNGRGTVKVATGGGKTLLALAAAQELQNATEPDLRLIVVVPTIPLMYQWLDEFRSSNLPPRAIGLMGGGEPLAPHRDLRVLICVINSARERLEEFVNTAEWPGRTMLVVDECHRANSEHNSRIFAASVDYTLGLSATPEQDAEEEELPSDEAYARTAVGQALGPIIYDFTLKQSAEAGLLTPFEVWHVALPLSDEEGFKYAALSKDIADLRKDLQGRHQRSRSQAGFLPWCQGEVKRRGPAADAAERFLGLTSQRKRLLYRAESRVAVTLDILGEASGDEAGRSIVFHESIDEVETLFLLALQRDLPAVLEHSKLPDALRAESIDGFRRGIARIIISAKSLVEGFNVPAADLGIIAASSGSVRQRIQSLGRLLRRKQTERLARIIVLYIQETEDERIYEKADWESVIGASRNRYFSWCRQAGADSWHEDLVETGRPPRVYRPSSWEADVSALSFADAYPGRTDGLALRVDQGGSLRAEHGGLAPASRKQITAIMELNTNHRAVRTPAGHLIVRRNTEGAVPDEWRYLGLIGDPDTRQPDVIELRIKRVSGRRVISKSGKGAKEHFALSAENGASAEAEHARRSILDWTAAVSSERFAPVHAIFWDGGSCYWMEVQGENLEYPCKLPPLEFRE